MCECIVDVLYIYGRDFWQSLRSLRRIFGNFNAIFAFILIGNFRNEFP